MADTLFDDSRTDIRLRPVGFVEMERRDDRKPAMDLYGADIGVHFVDEHFACGSATARRIPLTHGVIAEDLWAWAQR